MTKFSDSKTIYYIQITKRCNLRCIRCAAELHKYEKIDADLSWLLQLGIYNSNVIISGGEPLMIPDLYVFLDELVNRNNTIQLCTNGLFLKKNYNKINKSVNLNIGWKPDVCDFNTIFSEDYETALYNYCVFRRNIENDTVFDHIKQMRELTQEYYLIPDRFDTTLVQDYPEIFTTSNILKKKLVFPKYFFTIEADNTISNCFERSYSDNMENNITECYKTGQCSITECNKCHAIGLLTGHSIGGME